MNSSEAELSNTTMTNNAAAIASPTNTDANQMGKPRRASVLMGVPQITAMNSASRKGVRILADMRAPAIMMTSDAIIRRVSLTLSVDKLLEPTCFSILLPFLSSYSCPH